MKEVVVLDAKKIKEITNIKRMNPEVNENALNKLAKLNKVEVEVKKEVKVDGRKNNTGRPVNKKSARQARLAKQAFYAVVNDKFQKGNQFEVNGNVYAYCGSKHGKSGNGSTLGCIVNEINMHVCNVDYIGRTKVQAYTFVMGKRVSVELNLKTLKFVK